MTKSTFYCSECNTFGKRFSPKKYKVICIICDAKKNNTPEETIKDLAVILERVYGSL